MSRPPDRVDASLAAFRTPYLQLAGLEIDIIPAELNELASAQAMAVGDQSARGRCARRLTSVAA